MGFDQFLKVIYKRIRIIIAVSILVSVITAIVSLFAIEPVYESFSTLYIINKNTDVNEAIDYNNVMVNQQLVKDYRELVTSRLVTKEALEELKITDISSDSLSQKISVNMKGDTRVLVIGVRDTDPSRARQLADAVSNAFIKKAVSLMNVNNVNIVDSAEIPTSPVRPKPVQYTLLCFLASIVVTIGIILLIEYLNDTIKSTEDVEAFLGLNVIGIIPSTTIK